MTIRYTRAIERSWKRLKREGRAWAWACCARRGSVLSDQDIRAILRVPAGRPLTNLIADQKRFWFLPIFLRAQRRRHSENKRRGVWRADADKLEWRPLA